jgi:hypothetical protein
MEDESNGRVSFMNKEMNWGKCSLVNEGWNVVH